jgi:hypothetical protein
MFRGFCMGFIYISTARPLSVCPSPDPSECLTQSSVVPVFFPQVDSGFDDSGLGQDAAAARRGAKRKLLDSEVGTGLADAHRQRAWLT